MRTGDRYKTQELARDLFTAADKDGEKKKMRWKTDEAVCHRVGVYCCHRFYCSKQGPGSQSHFSEARPCVLVCRCFWICNVRLLLIIPLFVHTCSGAGVQWTESGGDHRGGVRGRSRHAALDGSRTAHLEEVNVHTGTHAPPVMNSRPSVRAAVSAF